MNAKINHTNYPSYQPSQLYELIRKQNEEMENEKNKHHKKIKIKEEIESESPSLHTTTDKDEDVINHIFLKIKLFNGFKGGYHVWLYALSI